MKSTALFVSAIIFALVTALHILRLYTQASIVVNGTEVPYWINGVGAVVAALLSAWMFLAGLCHHHHCHKQDNP